MNRRGFLRNTVVAIGGIALKMEAVAAAADVVETKKAGDQSSFVETTGYHLQSLQRIALILSTRGDWT